MRLHLLFFVLFLIAPASHASMQIDRAIIYFHAGQVQRQDITISNPDSEPLYIETTVLEIRNPGAADEERVEVTDPEQMKLLVSPKRLVIPPGGKKRVRLVNLQPADDQERVYRVNLSPVTGPIESDTTGLKIVVGYQALVLVLPAEPQANIVADRQGRQLTLTNQGNTNVLLGKAEQCGMLGDTERCETVTGTRLYPGNQIELMLPYDAPIEFTSMVAEQYETMTFK